MFYRISVIAFTLDGTVDLSCDFEFDLVNMEMKDSLFGWEEMVHLN
jgi:hypothetical protein